MPVSQDKVGKERSDVTSFDNKALSDNSECWLPKTY
jgi:hypothetical protein